MPGPIPSEQLSAPSVRLSDRRDDPTFLDTVQAGFRQARDDQWGANNRKVDDAYTPVIHALTDASGKPWTRYVNLLTNRPDPDAIWGDITALRARNPKAFASLPGTKDEFDKQTQDSINRDIANDTDIAARGGMVPRLIGGFAGGMTDPLNLATMLIGVGGAKTIGQAVLRDAVLNAGVTAAQQPLVAMERRETGRSLSAGEAATNIGLAGAIGGAFGGAVKGAELHVAPVVGDALASARETGLAAAWPHLPEAVRQRWKSASDVGDADWPDLAETVIGRDNMSADEQAAAHVVRRETEVAQANPFQPNGAGVAGHQERLDGAMRAILADLPAPPPASRPRFADSTAISSGTVSDLPARDAVKNRIAVAESAGSNTAANPLSSARGKYQFLSDTWLSYYKRRYGDGGLSDPQILAKRADGRLQDTLMNDLLADNAAFLRRRGEPETAGNLYLVHFAGQGGAKRLFDASAGARAADLLGDRVVAANPFLRDMTAGDVIAWAERRMGEAPSVRGPRDIGGGADEAPIRASVQQEIDRLQAERAALDQPRTAEAGAVEQIDATELPRGAEPGAIEQTQTGDMPAARPAEAVSLEPDRIGTEDSPVLADTHDVPMPMVMPKRRAVRRGPSDLMRFLSDAGGIADNEGHDLVNGAGLQKFVPGSGMLIRKGGMSIDRAREMAAEAGYFHGHNAEDAWSNTSTADFLDLLTQAHGAPHYSRADLAEVATRDEARARSAAFAEAKGRVDARLPEHGVEFTSTEIARAADHMVATGATSDEAIAHVVNQHMQDALDAMAIETEGGRYAELAEHMERTLAGDTGGLPRSSDGPAPVGGDEGGSGASASQRGRDGTYGREAGLSDTRISPEAARAFDDPDGPAAQMLADSLEHDARAAIDPAIAERQAQSAKLKAASPMRAAVDQDSMIGSPLFDAADQHKLQLDEDGPSKTLAEWLDEFDAKDTAIKHIGDCL